MSGMTETPMVGVHSKHSWKRVLPRTSSTVGGYIKRTQWPLNYIIYIIHYMNYIGVLEEKGASTGTIRGILKTGPKWKEEQSFRPKESYVWKHWVCGLSVAWMVMKLGSHSSHEGLHWPLHEPGAGPSSLVSSSPLSLASTGQVLILEKDAVTWIQCPRQSSSCLHGIFHSGFQELFILLLLMKAEKLKDQIQSHRRVGTVGLLNLPIAYPSLMYGHTCRPFKGSWFCWTHLIKIKDTGKAGHTYNPTTWWVNTGGSGVQGHCWLFIKFEASLDYVRFCLKNINPKR